MNPVADRIRRIAIASDNSGHALREWAFARWQAATVYPQAVTRWIKQIMDRIA
jgi:hypothetical protein